MNAQPHCLTAASPISTLSDSGSGVSTGTSAAESPPCEMLNLDELRNRCMGNIDLVNRVLKKFQTRFPEELAEMKQALECGDSERIARVAHRVKGTSASVSAKRWREPRPRLKT